MWEYKRLDEEMAEMESQFLKYLGKKDPLNIKSRDTGGLSLLIKPTHKCNLNCEYCYDRPNRQLIGDVVMSLDMVRDIVERIPDDLPVSWIWHGGECTTIEPQWFRDATSIILSYPRKNIRFSMQSNGFKVSDEFLQMCKDCGISIGFSFDYDTQEQRTHDNDLTWRTRDTITRAIKILGSAGVITVIHSGNIHKMKEMFESSKKLTQHPPAFNFVYESADPSKNELSLSKELYERYLEDFFLYVLTDRSKDATFERTTLCSLSMLLGKDANICLYGDCRYHYICIDPIGRVHPCDRFYEDKFIYPDVREFGSLLDYFKTPQYQLWYYMVESRHNYQCRKCGYWDMCFGGCNSTQYWACRDDYTAVNEDECAQKKITADAISRALLKIRGFDEFNTQIVNSSRFNSVVFPWELLAVVRKYDLGGDLRNVLLTEDQYRAICEQIGINFMPKNIPVLKYCRVLSNIRNGPCRAINRNTFNSVVEGSEKFVAMAIIEAVKQGYLTIPEEDLKKLEELK